MKTISIKKYSKPKVTLFEVFIEDNLCAGSALVSPHNPSDVITEWETDLDDNRSFTWE